MTTNSLRIGFVATRLAGTDGVSLESQKWSNILEELGHTCFYFAGESDRPIERSRVVPEAHFEHPLIRKINSDLFDEYCRTAETSGAIHDLLSKLTHSLREFIEDYELDAILVENALSLPMNIPLALALTELIAETNLPTIAHHHDCYWERERYAVSAAEDFMRASFPPVMPTIHHVVINSSTAKRLAMQTGVRATVIPNVMDFENPPPGPDEYSGTIRQSLGLQADEALLLQPTRIVPRKRIERSIELALWLDRPCSVVVTHSSGDEGGKYKEYLTDFASAVDVRLIFAAEHFAHQRHMREDGQKVYSLGDAYQVADLVTYPSIIEGFGNAFLETIYYRRPLLMCRYEIFKVDIRPKGFQVIGFESFIDRETVLHAQHVLDEPESISAMVEKNYNLGRRYYSYDVLRRRLSSLMARVIEQSEN